MKPARGLGIGPLLLSAAVLACSVLAPAGAATPPAATPTALASQAPSAEPVTATLAASPVDSPVPSTATRQPTEAATPTATAAPLQLEIVQSQAWTDDLGLVRVNVLLRNPYDFPVAPAAASGVSVLNAAGKHIRSSDLYFFDGISGGAGFLLPGETVAANACFTCETSPLPEQWASVEFVTTVVDATDEWHYSTEVEPTLGPVDFDAGSPIFWASGKVKNNTEAALSRISVRVFVFDEAGKLVGAAEASAWEVGPGAVADFKGYGFGQAPSGPVTYQVTALGVTY
jgi:hypothetical protein